MSSGLFKKMLLTNYSLKNLTYKHDLALNNPPGLVCHKTIKPNKLDARLCLKLSVTSIFFVYSSFVCFR